jgi:hypothetical protein
MEERGDTWLNMFGEIGAARMLSLVWQVVSRGSTQHEGGTLYILMSELIERSRPSPLLNFEPNQSSGPFAPQHFNCQRGNNSLNLFVSSRGYIMTIKIKVLLGLSIANKTND